MATFRYWRFVLGTTNPNARVQIQEIALRSTAGGATLTVPGGSISADNSNTGEVVARLVDGSTSTSWGSGAGTVKDRQYVSVTYDFGTPTAVAEAAVFVSSNSYLHPGGGSHIQASNDGATWVVFGPPVDAYALGASSVWVVFPLTVADDTAVHHAPFSAPMRLPTAWPTGPLARTAPQPGLRFGYDSGAYRIAGSVYVNGTPDVPVSRRVRLFERVTGRMVGEVWSDSVTGSYAFERIPQVPGAYFVTAFDHTGVNNAVIKDQIQAVA